MKRENNTSPTNIPGRETSSATTTTGPMSASAEIAFAADRREKPKGDTWGTPRALFRDFDAEFMFSVDAAALPQNAKLARFWSPAEDGLKQPWDGERVWLNPPFSNIGPWISKAAERRAAVAVLLVPARMSAPWAALVWDDSGHPREGIEVRRMQRIKFEGAKHQSPWEHVAIIFWGPAS